VDEGIECVSGEEDLPESTSEVHVTEGKEFNAGGIGSTYLLFAPRVPIKRMHVAGDREQDEDERHR
jgi:hypothetical protein